MSESEMFEGVTPVSQKTPDMSLKSIQAKVPYDAWLNLRYAAMKSKMGLQEYISELCYLAEPFTKNL